MSAIIASRASRALAAAVTAAALAAPLAAQASGPGFAQCRSTAAVDFPGTIVDAAVATPALSTLTGLVVAAGLADALAAPGDLTVFAPTDAAFAAIPPAVLAAIGGDTAVLTAVLTYHVVPGRVDPRKPNTRKLETLQGQTLFAGWDRDGRAPMINQSKADCTAVRTSNGTVWIVDSVLLPQFR
jgi:uncharacterized surface protein with fasciclin (FAS1) repeats